MRFRADPKEGASCRVNIPTRVCENPRDLVDWLAAEMRTHWVKPEIEAFDVSHIHQAVAMTKDGRHASPLYVQFVMGVRNAMPVDRDVFDYDVCTMPRLASDAEWCAAGIGQYQPTLNEWCVAEGGHARTGLEDNVRLDPQRVRIGARGAPPEPSVGRRESTVD